MSTTPDRYKLVRAICYKCAEFFDWPDDGKVHGAVALCPACEQVDKWMQEANGDCDGENKGKSQGVNGIIGQAEKVFQHDPGPSNSLQRRPLLPGEDSSIKPDFFEIVMAKRRFLAQDPVPPCTHEPIFIVWHYVDINGCSVYSEQHKSSYGRCMCCWKVIPSPPVVLEYKPEIIRPLAWCDLVDIFKQKSRSIFASAKRRGEIKPQPCEVCGDTKSEGHHPDYSKPLEVVWLCRQHHGQADKARRAAEKMEAKRSWAEIARKWAQ